jgi:hypothetical protein
VIFSGQEVDRQGNGQEQRLAPALAGGEEGKTDSTQEAPGSGEEGRQDRAQSTARAYAPQNEPRPFEKVKPHPQQEALF